MSEPDAELDALIFRYFDGTLDADAADALRAALARPEALDRFAELSLDAQVIADRAAARRLVPPARRRLVWVAAAVMLASLASLPWLLRAPQARPAEPVATLSAAEGHVRIGREADDARPGSPLRPGDTLTTVGVESSVVVDYLDGTRLVLGGDTSVTLGGDVSRLLQVHNGEVSLEARPHDDGSTMRVTTPEAELESASASLLVSRGEQRTRVSVTEGSVKVTRLSDGRSVESGPGEKATAAAGVELRSVTMASVPDEYRADLSSGWELGEPVADGPRLALRALPRVGGMNGLRHQVRSENAWTEGLCLLHPDSMLTFRYRVEKRGFFHAILVARGPDPKNPGCVLYFTQDDLWKKSEAGQWQTANVPLAQLRRNVKGGPFAEPLVAFLVIFDTGPDNRGLTVESVSISRGPKP